MRTRTVMAVALVALLALTGTASAATVKLSGTLLNDEDKPSGKISCKATVKKGAVRKISGVRLKNVATRCLSEDGVRPGPTITTWFPGSFEAEKQRLGGGKVVYTFQGLNIQAAGAAWGLRGVIKKNGHRVQNGEISTAEVPGARAGERCSVLSQFGAKAKKK